MTEGAPGDAPRRATVQGGAPRYRAKRRTRGVARHGGGWTACCGLLGLFAVGVGAAAFGYLLAALFMPGAHWNLYLVNIRLLVLSAGLWLQARRAARRRRGR